MDEHEVVEPITVDIAETERGVTERSAALFAYPLDRQPQMSRYIPYRQCTLQTIGPAVQQVGAAARKQALANRGGHEHIGKTIAVDVPRRTDGLDPRRVLLERQAGAALREGELALGVNRFGAAITEMHERDQRGVVEARHREVAVAVPIDITHSRGHLRERRARRQRDVSRREQGLELG